MVDERRNPLELEAVVRRFADSAESLANVREQLRILTELRDSEERAKENLHDSAEQVSLFVVQAASVLRALEDAMAKITEVLNVGGDLISGAELRGITGGVEANAVSIAQVDGRVDALDAKVMELAANVVSLEATIGQEVGGLKAVLREVLAAAKEPKIVKRLF